jgi:hypothetical protein
MDDLQLMTVLLALVDFVELLYIVRVERSLKALRDTIAWREAHPHG